MDVDNKIHAFIQSVLNQGIAINQDDAAGRFRTYDEFTQRISNAARERAVSPEWQAIVAALKGQGDE